MLFVMIRKPMLGTISLSLSLVLISVPSLLLCFLRLSGMLGLCSGMALLDCLRDLLSVRARKLSQKRLLARVVFLLSAAVILLPRLTNPMSGVFLMFLRVAARLWSFLRVSLFLD